MMKLFVFALFFLGQFFGNSGNQKIFTPASSSTPTFVDACQSSDAGNPYVCSVTTTTGSTILVNTITYDNGIPTLTDSNTGTISKISGPLSFYSNGNSFVFVIVNAGDGEHDLSISYDSGGHYAGMQAIAVSGVSSGSPVNAVASASSGCPNITTTVPSTLLVSFATQGGGDGVGSASNAPQAMTTVFSSSLGSNIAYGTLSNVGVNTTTWVGWSPSLKPDCEPIALH